MTCQSLISDLSDVESPSVATARMHLLLRFSRDGALRSWRRTQADLVCARNA